MKLLSLLESTKATRENNDETISRPKIKQEEVLSTIKSDFVDSEQLAMTLIAMTQNSTRFRRMELDRLKLRNVSF